MSKALDIFYVYEHWRPDKDICFWVGKGHGNRARTFRRSLHYNNIVKKLSRLGMCVEVRMVQSGMLEKDALALEIERIAFWRAAGVKLANITSGGEGTTGLKHSEETKKKIREKRKTQVMVKLSAETYRKIAIAVGNALRGRKNPAHSAKMKGRKHSEEHKKNIGAGLIGRECKEETRAKIGAANKDKIRTEETIQNLRNSHIGNVHSLETREKMSASHKNQWADEEERRKQSDRIKALWADPAHREKRARGRLEKKLREEILP